MPQLGEYNLGTLFSKSDPDDCLNVWQIQASEKQINLILSYHAPNSRMFHISDVQ